MIYATPKFISGVTTVIITNSYMDPVFNDPQVYEQVSPITGFRNYVNAGDRSHFIVTVLLEKYTNPKTMLNTLLSFKGVTVDEFYVDKDGEAVYDKSGGKAKYIITSVVPLYLVDRLRYTIAILRFDSLGYVKAPEFKYTYLGDDSGNIIGDDDGFKIIL